jgi:DNA-binding CsgD family transcriptional regulator
MIETIASYTDQMIKDCALDSASVFCLDSSLGQRRLSYLHHVGVSAEAQHIYATRGVFLSDPYGQVPQGAEGFIRWMDPRLDHLIEHAMDYRGFLMQHDVEVVGAWSHAISPDLSLIVGTHRRRGARWPDDVPMALLQHQLCRLRDITLEHLLGQMLSSAAGRVALRFALPCALDGPRPEVSLSERETEITALICGGKQNKQVAWLLGISEFTVENHLRRIYRKLGIHSRSALVAHFSRRVH